jgi:hypothetical protein
VEGGAVTHYGRQDVLENEADAVGGLAAHGCAPS